MKAAYGILILWALLSLVGPLTSSYDPYAANVQRIFAPPSAAHWLGTDHLGRDLWSRWTHGAQNTLLLLLGAGGISTLGGVACGVLVGMQRQHTNAIMRGILYGVLALPPLVIALLVVTPLPRTLATVAIAAGVAQMPSLTNIIASETRRILGQDFCLASHALGATWLHLAYHCVLRNLVPVLNALLPMTLAYSLLTASTLSFLGLAERPDLAEWGALLAESRFYFQELPLGSLLPGVSLFVVIASLHRLSASAE